MSLYFPLALRQHSGRFEQALRPLNLRSLMKRSWFGLVVREQ